MRSVIVMLLIFVACSEKNPTVPDTGTSVKFNARSGDFDRCIWTSNNSQADALCRSLGYDKHVGPIVNDDRSPDRPDNCYGKILEVTCWKP
jgi:hypothetical protein